MYGWRFEVQHLIPKDDDLVHVESMDCPCGPLVVGHPLLGGPGVCHRTVRAEPLPDAPPEEWDEEWDE